VSNPYLFADVEQRFFDPNAKVLSRAGVLQAWLPYLGAQLQEGVPLARMTRHALSLFHGCPGARQWRRALSEEGTRPGADLSVLHAALVSLKAAA
jgi:tRNA-dihydrouridine synthase A